MKYLGCAYYPEYWGEDRLEEDCRLMAEAGINLVRIGEFAWCRMEPADGKYDLGWLHRSIEAMARRGIGVLMCTPTSAPPAWLTSAHPETCMVRADGTRAGHGHRRHYCPTSGTFLTYSDRITDVLSREMSHHTNVVGWQIDNELGPESGWCHCESCQSGFREWLRARYGSVGELNRRWGTGFWGMDYSDFGQVLLGGRGTEAASRNLDTARFRSHSFVEFARRQAAIIRRNHTGTLVTTNGMGPIYTPIDYHSLFADLDVACDDLYFDIATMDASALAMNIFRSIKPGRRYWLAETGAGALDHMRPPRAAQFNAWAWSSFAHGADAHLVFRWRTCLSGQEQELQGILEHSGAPRHRYQAVKECFNGIIRARDKFGLGELPLPEAPVAILLDYDSLWAYEASRMNGPVSPVQLIIELHQELYRRGVIADFVPADRDLSGYRLLVLPSTVIIPEGFPTRLREFVEGGGTVLAVGQIGMRDSCASYLSRPGPDGLEDLLGCEIHGGMYLESQVDADEALWMPAAKKRSFTMPLAGSLGSRAARGAASSWAGDVTLRGGKALAKFTADAYSGQPALVGKATGRGNSLYLAALRTDTAFDVRLMDYALSLARVKPGPRIPEHVEVIRRGDVTFAVNHLNKPVRVRLGTGVTSLIGRIANGAAMLGPYGVCVVRHSASKR